MFDGDFITIFFRITNFIIICYLALYLFQKYILTFVKKGIVLKKRALKELKGELRELKKKYHEHERSMEQQAQLSRQLNDKVVQWHAVFDKQQKQREKQQAYIAQVIRKRVHRQSEYVTRLHIQSSVIPQAVDQAQAELQDKFAQEHAGDIFLKKLVDSMREHGA